MRRQSFGHPSVMSNKKRVKQMLKLERERAGILISRNILCQSQHHLCGAPHSSPNSESHSGPHFDLHSGLLLWPLTLALTMASHYGLSLKLLLWLSLWPLTQSFTCSLSLSLTLKLTRRHSAHSNRSSGQASMFIGSSAK